MDIAQVINTSKRKGIAQEDNVSDIVHAVICIWEELNAMNSDLEKNMVKFIVPPMTVCTK